MRFKNETLKEDIKNNINMTSPIQKFKTDDDDDDSILESLKFNSLINRYY